VCIHVGRYLHGSMCVCVCVCVCVCGIFVYLDSFTVIKLGVLRENLCD